MDPQDKRLVLSILQELTVAALELFEPERPMTPFLERVSERMGCLAVLVMAEPGNAPPRLLAATGLSAASRALRVGHGPLPYPELAASTLARWRFPLDDADGTTLMLCFDGEPAPADQYRGMMRRLATTFATALDHRRLFSRTLESEAAARAAIAAREELVAVVSHDLKSPLATISMTAGLLLGGPVPPADARRALERIQRSVDRMSRLIHDLLDLAQLEGGHLAIELTAQELPALLAETLELFRVQATGRGQRLELFVEPGAEPVRCDRDRVLQVLANLVDNALKFTPDGGEISLLAESAGNEVMVSVRDTGPGIPAEHVAHIFDRYWQGQHTGAKGTGLGLSIARGLVELHGGRLWVTSEVGGGSTFSFTLPAG
jgi:signal transduction histidine kinase